MLGNQSRPPAVVRLVAATLGVVAGALVIWGLYVTAAYGPFATEQSEAAGLPGGLWFLLGMLGLAVSAGVYALISYGVHASRRQRQWARSARRRTGNDDDDPEDRGKGSR